MSSQYALCAKVDGKLAYLNRIVTVEYNTSRLQLPMTIYQFGELGEDTLIADKDNWKLFLDNKMFKEITSFMPDIDFTSFRIAFCRVEEVKSYTTQICVPFHLNGILGEEGYSSFEADINWDNFC